MRSRVLMASLVLNIAFLCVGTVYVVRKGGISWLIGLVAHSQQEAGVKPRHVDANIYRNYIDSPLYLGKVATYAAMPNSSRRIVFVGDSLTELGPWDEMFKESVLNRGIGGDTLAGLRRRIDEILRHNPGKLFIMIGINDLLGGADMEALAKEYADLMKYIKLQSPGITVFVQSVLPINLDLWNRFTRPRTSDRIVMDILALNSRLAALDDRSAVFFIDVYSKMIDEGGMNASFTSDGVHLNGAGYKRWSDVVVPYVER